MTAMTYKMVETHLHLLYFPKVQLKVVHFMITLLKVRRKICHNGSYSHSDCPMSLLADPGDFLNLSVLSGSEAEIRKSETTRMR